MPSRIRGILKWIALAAAVAASGLGILMGSLTLDKTRVFYEVAGEFGRTEVISSRETDTSVIQLVQIYNSRDEYLLDCWYRKPKRLAADHRVLVLYAGVKTKAVILDLIPERPDLVVCAVQYPYERPRTVLEYLKWPSTTRASAYRVVAGGMLATTYLIDRENYDPSRLIVVGASLGSFFGTIHGALDPRIAKTLVVHGGGGFSDMIKSYKRLREKGRPVRLYAWLGETVFGTFDPLRYVDRISPREVVILATRHDKYFSPESSQALYDRAKDPKKIFWMETAHVKSEKSEIVESILRSLSAYLFPSPAPTADSP